MTVTCACGEVTIQEGIFSVWADGILHFGPNRPCVAADELDAICGDHLMIDPEPTGVFVVSPEAFDKLTAALAEPPKVLPKLAALLKKAEVMRRGCEMTTPQYPGAPSRDALSPSTPTGGAPVFLSRIDAIRTLLAGLFVAVVLAGFVAAIAMRT